MMTMMKGEYTLNQKITVLLIGIIILVFVPLAVLAKEYNEEVVFIGPDEIIDENLFVVANTVEIQGEINGDVIVAAGVLNIKGKIEGDVIGFAGEATIGGPVSGDVRLASGNMFITNVVGGNLNALAGTITLSDDVEIGHSIVLAAGRLELDGAVVKDITGALGHATLNAPIGGNVFLYIDNQGLLVLDKDARIGGDVHYSGKQELKRVPGAEVAGIIKRIELEPVTAGSTFFIGYLFSFIVSVLALLVVGLLFIHVFPKMSKHVAQDMTTRPLKLILLGFAYSILIPIAIIILLVTIIGIPLALIIGALYVILLYLAKVFASLALGVWIFSKTEKKNEKLIFPFTIGALLLSVAKFIPFLGWAVGALVLWWGLAGLVEWVKTLPQK